MKQPTAYAMFRDGEFYDAIHPDEYDKTAGEYDIPLYTHPSEHDLGIAESIGFDKGYKANKKELTDEEMKDLIQEYWGDVHIVDPDGYLHEIAFIRAILRKASEK